MLLTLVIILILIWSAIVGSLYSNFLVFYENFTQTENYHKARYASIAALERAELVIRQREPWYAWSWWRIESIDQAWSPSDQMPAGRTGFSYLSRAFPSESTIFWNINSKTDRIPSKWNGNVEKLLSADDSPDYNMMDYENAEIFLLYYDKWEGKPYDKKSCLNLEDCNITENLEWIKVAIRLPPYIKDKLGLLDTDNPLIRDWWHINDAIVDRQIRWNFYEVWESTAFTVFATQEALWYWTGENDSAIRESHLNQSSWLTMDFSDKRNPITYKRTSPTIISPKDSTISELTNAFKDIFHNSTNLQLRLSLLNLVLWNWEPWKRYPFLEYYVEFIPDTIVSDRFFTIETEWNYWDYKIDNILYKPTITESILKSFTTIF